MEEVRAIARLKRGDIGGLAVLVERYQVKAARTAYLIVSDRALAEDIVQSAFVRVYERIHQFDVHRPFELWFMRIIVNDALQVARKNQRQVSLDRAITPENDVTFAEILPDTTPALEAMLEENQNEDELREAVHHALQALPPEQRAVIVLRYYLGLSESQLSAELAAPPGTIKWRLHAARKQLRMLLHREEV